MNEILVLGAGGMLGRAVSLHFERAGWKVTRSDRKSFDIARDPLARLEPVLAGKSAVVNCSGVIKPEITRYPIEDVLQVNTLFPRSLALLAKRLAVPCFHVTTDAVFSGSKGSYTEIDSYDAQDVYALTKCGGESAECMTLRTSVVGEEEPGRGRSLLAWAQSRAGSPVDGFTNHLWNGLTTPEFAAVIESILRKEAYQPGIFHLHSPAPVTKFELLTLLNQAYDLKLEIKPVAAPTPCDRSLGSVYDVARHFARKTVATQIAEMKRFFAL